MKEKKCISKNYSRNKKLIPQKIKKPLFSKRKQRFFYFKNRGHELSIKKLVLHTMNIKEFFNQLFSSEKNFPQQKEEIIYEQMEISEEEKLSGEVWANSIRKERLVELIHQKLIHQSSHQDDAVFKIDFIEGRSTFGFVCYYAEKIFSPADFQHFFEYLKEQVKAQGYVLQLSDSKTILKKDVAETKERHYLKPRFKLNDEQTKINQAYGNVTIEYFKINDKPDHLKFYLHYYHDHKYTEALIAEDLIVKVLG